MDCYQVRFQKSKIVFKLAANMQTLNNTLGEIYEIHDRKTQSGNVVILIIRPKSTVTKVFVRLRNKF